MTFLTTLFDESAPCFIPCDKPMVHQSDGLSKLNQLILTIHSFIHWGVGIATFVRHQTIGSTSISMEWWPLTVRFIIVFMTISTSVLIVVIIFIALLDEIKGIKIMKLLLWRMEKQGLVCKGCINRSKLWSIYRWCLRMCHLLEQDIAVSSLGNKGPSDLSLIFTLPVFMILTSPDELKCK